MLPFIFPINTLIAEDVDDASLTWIRVDNPEGADVTARTLNLIHVGLENGVALQRLHLLERL